MNNNILLNNIHLMEILSRERQKKINILESEIKLKEK